MGIFNKADWCHIMKEAVHMPRPVLMLFGDKDILKLNAELLIVIADPVAEVVNVFGKVVTVLFIGVECQSDKVFPRIAESVFTNTRPSASEIARELIFVIIFKGNAENAIRLILGRFGDKAQIGNFPNIAVAFYSIAHKKIQRYDTLSSSFAEQVARSA